MSWQSLKAESFFSSFLWIISVGGDSDENLGGSPQDSADTTMNLFGGTNKCASTTEVKRYIFFFSGTFSTSVGFFLLQISQIKLWQFLTWKLQVKWMAEIFWKSFPQRIGNLKKTSIGLVDAMAAGLFLKFRLWICLSRHKICFGITMQVYINIWDNFQHIFLDNTRSRQMTKIFCSVSLNYSDSSLTGFPA